MKKQHYLILLFFLIGITVNAQKGFSHLTAKGGYTYEGDLNFEVGYELNKQYHNNWSIFFSGFLSSTESQEIRNWTTGIYYEPNIMASKNHLLNLKIGGSLGTNEEEFIADGILGLEYNYAFTDKMKFTVFFKNSHMFNSAINFRHALLIGLKHRL